MEEDIAPSDLNKQNSSEDVTAILNELVLEKQKAENILNMLKSLTANWEVYKDIFETIEKEVKGTYDSIKSTKSLNTKFYNDLLQQQEEISSSLERARGFLNESKVIQKNIGDIEKNLKWRENNVWIVKDNVLQIRKDANDLKSKIKKELDQTIKIWKEVDVVLNKIKDNKVMANQMISYIQTVNNQAKTNQLQINKLLEQWKQSLGTIKAQENWVNSFFNQSNQKTKDILSWHDKIFNPWWIKEKILQIDSKIKNNQILIENQLSQASSNRLTNALRERLNKIENALWYWKFGVIMISSILFLFSLVRYFCSEENSKFDLLQNIELMYPAIFLLIFFVLQYVRTNKFYEEYYFKYISAFWLPAYFELLESKDDKQAVNYLIDTIERIHANPAKEINQNSKDTVFDYVIEWIKWFFWHKKLDLNKIVKDLTKEQLWEIFEYLQQKVIK